MHARSGTDFPPAVRTGRHVMLPAFAAGIMAALALAPVYWIVLLPAAFCILVRTIDRCTGRGPLKKTAGKAFLAGWSFGAGYFPAGLYWLAFAFFVQAESFAWMAPVAIAGLCAFLALFTGAACAVCVLFWRHGWQRIFLFAAVWSISEYIRGHILTGLPWNLTGQVPAVSAVTVQTASWYGVYGLGLVTVLLACMPVVMTGGNKNTPLRLSGGIFLMVLGSAFLAAAGYVRLSLPGPQVQGTDYVRIVQPDISQRDKIDPQLYRQNFIRHLDLSRGEAPYADRIFVVWPENAVPFLAQQPGAPAMLDDYMPGNGILVTGAVHGISGPEGRERYYNSVFVIARGTDGWYVRHRYDKHRLVPLGEYLPLYGILRATGLSQLAPYSDGFSPGSGPALLDAGGLLFAPLICYEAAFPGQVYPAGRRPDWIVNVTNDAWFGNTSGPRQHLDMARLRAVETGLPLVRAANTGISALINAKGQIVEQIPLYRSGVIEAPLPPPLETTLYDRYGDRIFWCMVAVCLVAGLSSGKNARKEPVA